jgi:phage terminase large subunit GpA-like protein
MTPEQLDRASDLIAAWSAIIAPPPKWTISEWADHRRKLSGEAAAEKGQWRTNRAEYAESWTPLPIRPLSRLS